MCGICGVGTRGEEPDAALVRRMCRSIVYRGPDAEGILTRPGVGLGMRRLAIIDLSTGEQPMANETGSVQVVFNGEIYNYRELRAALERKGHRFETQSDTEVIPHLYEEHGLDFARELNGMFAIALWDDAAASPAAGPRSHRHQAALLLRTRRRSLLRLRGEVHPGGGRQRARRSISWVSTSS